MSYNDEAPLAASDQSQEKCAYCGITESRALVKCDSSGKFFCNGRSTTTMSGSHIIHHLIRAKTSSVSLHADSPLGEIQLECYNVRARRPALPLAPAAPLTAPLPPSPPLQCATTNSFLLGFVPARLDSVVVLLCRVCVENVPALKTMDWELNQWLPLIKDREYLPWLVKKPTDRQQCCAAQISAAQINALEELWKKHPDATLSDLDVPGATEDELQPMLLKYDDGFHYQNTLAPLVKVEGDCDRLMKEAQNKENISLRWDVGLRKNRVAIISAGAQELKVVVGDELRLRLGDAAARLFGDAWGSTGNVLWVTDSEMAVTVSSDAVPVDVHDGYVVEFVWKSICYDRMQTALRQFSMDDTSVSGYLYHKIIGHDIEPQTLHHDLPQALHAPGLPELNFSQTSAVRSVLEQPLSLIQGPPGTGKTTTSATIVYHLVRLTASQVLVCAPSNVAVDQLAESLERTGLRVVRLCAKSRESAPSAVDHIALHTLVRALKTPDQQELHKLQQLKDEQGELIASDERKYRRLKSKAERLILQEADVICTTCVGAGDPRLGNLRFRQVLIDEATQAMEAECVIPLVLGAKQLILVGDHRQLGPTVISKQAAKAGSARSLFDRLQLLGARPVRLEVQYRMHPFLSQFPSNAFYDGMLQNGVSSAERSVTTAEFPWPDPSKPTFFYVSSSPEEISPSGTSFLNRGEASMVEKIVTHFLHAGAAPSQIGVITPYEGQRTYTTSYMQRCGSLPTQLYKEIEVASVDSFQGREKDFIILSCVRSNNAQGIGFLSDPRRLNVALTRARYGVMLLGNPRVLSTNKLWHALIKHYQAHSLLVTGPLEELQTASVFLSAAPSSARDTGSASTRGSRPLENPPVNPSQPSQATQSQVTQSESQSGSFVDTGSSQGTLGTSQITLETFSPLETFSLEAFEYG